MRGLVAHRGLALPTGRPVGRITRHLAAAVREEVEERIRAGELERPRPTRASAR